MNVNWENYIWEEKHVATIEQVKEVESILKIKFPKDYLEIAMQHQGQTPVPCGVSTGSMITTLLNFENDLESSEYTYSIVDSHKVFKNEHYSPLLIPIALAGGASLFCFDYRVSKKNPTIVFIEWDSFGKGNEKAIHPVAKNFSKFLSMLEE